jgi:hypothetical protein
MHEEGANPCGLGARVDQFALAHAIQIAPKHGLSPTPTATADDEVITLNDEVGAITDELSIHAEHSTHSGIHLCLGVAVCLEFLHGEVDQPFQSWSIGFRG